MKPFRSFSFLNLIACTHAYTLYFFFQTINELKKRLLSTILTSLREGLAAIRIAEYLNEKLKSMGIANDSGPAGGVLFIDTGEQSSLAGIGKIYDNFLRTGEIKNYTGF